MFYLQRSFVPDPTGIKTDRFPILYDDPTEKTFVRMTANNSLTVFNAKEEKWEEYFPIVGSRINVSLALFAKRRRRRKTTFQNMFS